MKISPGMMTPAQQMDVGLAQSLGMVGESFTAIARIWRGQTQDMKYVHVPEKSTANAIVFSTPGASVADYKQGKALTLGIGDGRLLMSFGPTECKTKTQLPMEQWVMAAWAYDALAKEQRLYLNGRTVQIC